MLNSLEPTEDLLSGSECSSLATSPIQEDGFNFGLQSSEAQHRYNERFDPKLSRSKPVAVVKMFLDHMSEAHVAKSLIATDADIECCSCIPLGHDLVPSRAVQTDLNDLLASCSLDDIEIDNIFGCGADVAAFGHFACQAEPLEVSRNVLFSIWARIDAETGQIVRLRWMDGSDRAGRTKSGGGIEIEGNGCPQL